MANISQKQKQQQFGLKLVLIALVVGITFTVWYFAEKTWNKESGNTPKILENTNKVSIPGDDLSSLKDKYLELAEKVMTEGYGNVMLADSFKLMLGWQEDGLIGEKSHGYLLISDVKTANNFWKDLLGSNYGEINKKNIEFRVLGNSVQISFQTDKQGKITKFRRTLVFGNYQKDQRNIDPAIMADMLEKNIEDENKSENMIKKVGDTVSYEQVDVVKNNQTSKVQIFSKDNNQWKVLFFYPTDFSNSNPSSYLSLLENAEKFAELKTDIMVVSVDPIAVHQAWEKCILENFHST